MTECDECGLPATIKRETPDGDTICIRCQTDDNGNKLLKLDDKPTEMPPGNGNTRDRTPQQNNSKAYNNGHPYSRGEEIRRWW